MLSRTLPTCSSARTSSRGPAAPRAYPGSLLAPGDFHGLLQHHHHHEVLDADFGNSNRVGQRAACCALPARCQIDPADAPARTALVSVQAVRIASLKQFYDVKNVDEEERRKLCVPSVYCAPGFVIREVDPSLGPGRCFDANGE